MKKLSLEEVILRFRKKHGNEYDYSLITSENYIDTKHEVEIICNTCGNVFRQLPSVHLLGCGCRLCANKKISESKIGVARKDMRHLIYGVGVCDVEHSVFDKIGHVETSYNVWHDMLKRCYDKTFQKRQPTYIGCSVCDEWKKYSNFKRWFNDHKNEYKDGYALDKDILFKGNKVYSPDTCCFVPQEINTLLTNRKNHRGKYPLGVSKASYSDNYEAAVYKNGKRVHIGTFKTVEEAFDAYKQTKEAHIKDVAQKYFNEGKITKSVYDALLNYKIEITD